MAELEWATIEASKYNAEDGTKKWYNAYSNKKHHVYSGYATWHGEDDTLHNWRSCLHIKTTTKYNSSYKLNSLIVPLVSTQKVWPYHTKAFLTTSKYEDVSPKSITEKSGKLDTTLQEDFSKKVLSSAWSTSDVDGLLRFDNYVPKGTTIYFVFKDFTLEPEKDYFIYFVRQGSCAKHGSHGQSGFLNGVCNEANITVDYIPEVTFEITQSLNGGQAENLNDADYGEIRYSLSYSEQIDDKYKFKVPYGNKFVLNSVTPEESYEYVGDPTPITKVLTEDCTHEIPFKTKYKINYLEKDEENSRILSCSYFLHGDAGVTIDGYPIDKISPVYSFGGWYCNGTTYYPGKKYDYSTITKGVVGETLAANTYNFRPIFTSKQCSVEYIIKDDFQLNKSSQDVTYGKKFILGVSETNVEMAKPNKNNVAEWNILAPDGTLLDIKKHLSEIIYEWEYEKVYAEPVLTIVNHNIQFKIDDTPGSASRTLSIPYGSSLDPKEYDLYSELKIPDYATIVKWQTGIADGFVLFDGTDDDWDTLLKGKKDTDESAPLYPVLKYNDRMVVYDGGEWYHLTAAYYKGEKWFKLSPTIVIKESR